MSHNYADRIFSFRRIIISDEMVRKREKKKRFNLTKHPVSSFLLFVPEDDVSFTINRSFHLSDSIQTGRPCQTRNGSISRARKLPVLALAFPSTGSLLLYWAKGFFGVTRDPTSTRLLNNEGKNALIKKM